MQLIKIEKNDAGQRLDRFLRKSFKNAPLSLIYRLIRKNIKLNGRRAKKDTVLSEGDELKLYIDENSFSDLRTRKTSSKIKKQFHIIYEDDDILVVDKPKSLLTHGSAVEKKNTLANQVLSYLISEKAYSPIREASFTPAPANRLDRNTSGIVVFGKNAESLRKLNLAFHERHGVRKFYLAIVCGNLTESLTISESIVKTDFKKHIFKSDKSAELKEDSISNLKDALTLVKPLHCENGYTLIEAEIKTGRTHQIRVHLAERGYPIAGDPKYGDAAANSSLKSRFGLKSQLLHAYKLEIFGDEYLSSPDRHWNDIIEKLFPDYGKKRGI